MVGQDIGPLTDRSEGFALTGYDIPGCVEDGAWMLWDNSSVVAAVVAAVAHPDFENGHFLRFITESELPECADRSVSSKRVPPTHFLRKVVVGKKTHLQKEFEKYQQQPQTGIA